jgi:hypothetical protein
MRTSAKAGGTPRSSASRRIVGAISGVEDTTEAGRFSSSSFAPATQEVAHTVDAIVTPSPDGRVMDRLILHERWLSSLDAKAPPAHTIDVTSGANQPDISSTERRRYASDWSQNRGIG